MANQIPRILRLALGSWVSIQAKVDAIAAKDGWPTYSQAPELYRFEGWGTVGFPPRIACNVKHFPFPGEEVDLGRIVA